MVGAVGGPEAGARGREELGAGVLGGSRQACHPSCPRSMVLTRVWGYGWPNGQMPAGPLVLRVAGGQPRGMSHPLASWNSAITALDVRSQLMQLEREHALALREGLGEVRTYMAELETELEYVRGLYAATVVTEIATLRGELFGPEVG